MRKGAQARPQLVPLAAHPRRFSEGSAGLAQLAHEAEGAGGIVPRDELPDFVKVGFGRRTVAQDSH